MALCRQLCCSGVAPMCLCRGHAVMHAVQSAKGMLHCVQWNLLCLLVCHVELPASLCRLLAIGQLLSCMSACRALAHQRQVLQALDDDGTAS